jgi:formylglycine-generating enzyme required for sulfatase activity
VIGALTLAACSPAQKEPAAAPVPAWREPVTGMVFLHVAPGRFRMGSGPEEKGRQEDETPHEVVLTRGFYLGRHEVTRAEWTAVMGRDPSQVRGCGPRCPVETVSYLSIQEFIERLDKLSPDGSRFRLPTEAEWEYACRAGTSTPFSTGGNLTTEQANYDGRYPYEGHPPGRYLGRPAPVGSYLPNPWGFHDLHGNVWEWCEDRYGPSPAGEVRDPRGPDTGGRRVIRGGSWYFDANSARCALRYTHAVSDLGFSLGFRLVREAPQP